MKKAGSGMGGRSSGESSAYAGSLPNRTQSVCPECLKIIPALIFEKDGKVWIEKSCDRHGKFSDLYWGDAKMYDKARSFAVGGKITENPCVKKKDPVCPKDCGLCSDHLSHTALANLVVTNRCDLSCWYCFFFAKKAGYIYEPTLEELRKAVKLLRAERPVPGNAIQLTGGNPELRTDLFEIIDMIKEEGVEHVQVNINGTHRLWNDPEWTQKLRDHGVNTIYLSFDGVTPKTNPKNHWEIPFMFENARNANIGLVLVPTVINTVNDHGLGDIIRFGFKNMDVVRGVNFQPVSLVGRMPRKEREKFRITIPDAIKRIEEQTDGQISREDFYTVPSIHPVTNFVEALLKKPQYDLTTHFACGMATYVFHDEGKMIPITRFVDVEGLFEYLNGRAEDLRNGTNKLVVGAKMLVKLNSFIDKKKAPKGFGLANILYNALMKHDYGALGAFHHKSMFIGMMHFMDLYNYDINRVRRCSIHYLTPEAIIPFCAFNVIPEWYRDKVQSKYSIPIAKWEKKTGTKLDSTLYMRDIKKIVSSPVYRKVYEGFL
jgi:hypothetical protein